MSLCAKTIPILIAADEEWRVVKKCLLPSVVKAYPFGEWFNYTLHADTLPLSLIFFQTGCGKIPAAAATQYVIDKLNPKLIINLGTCGGFDGLVKRLDILLVKETVVYDIHERSGNKDAQTNKYRTSLDLSWIKEPYSTNAKSVTLATADQDLDPKIIPRLIKKYEAVAADWESGAIAYVAEKNKVKCLILRGVSDVVDPNGKPSNEKEIIEGAAGVIKKLIGGLPRWISKVNCIRL